MNEILTAEEFEKRFATDWAVLGKIEAREDLSLVSGRISTTPLDEFHVVPAVPELDEVFATAPARTSGTIAVTLQYQGRSRPIPVEAPWAR